MNKNISAIIVDDELEAINYLEILLKENFPEINIVDTANNSSKAVKAIKSQKPELVFMDIQLDEKSGFDILKELDINGGLPYIIFVTAFSKYAIDAYKTNALDCLVKPVENVDLLRAVGRFYNQWDEDNHYQNILSLFNISKSKIKFNTRSGYIFLSPDEIIYCKADKNYTKIITTHNSTHTVSVNLGEIEKELNRRKFWRCSRSHIINLDFIHEIDRKKKSCYLLVNDVKTEVPINLKRLKGLDL